MYIIPTNKAAWHAIGHRLGLIMMWVNRSYSTGEVRLTSADPDAKPDVDFDMCSDWRDMDRMVMGVKMMIRLQAHPAIRQTVEEIFPVSFSDRARKYAVYSRSHAVQTALGGALMDSAAPLRRLMIRTLIADGPSIDGPRRRERNEGVDPRDRARPLARDLDLPHGRVRRSRAP